MTELQNHLNVLRKNKFNLSNDEAQFWASQSELKHAKHVDPLVTEMNMTLFKLSEGETYDLWIKDVWRNSLDVRYVKRIELLSNYNSKLQPTKETYLRTYDWPDYGIPEDMVRTYLMKKLEALNHKCRTCKYCAFNKADSFLQDDKIGVCQKQNKWIRLYNPNYPCSEAFKNAGE